jgi:hypothetical protein
MDHQPPITEPQLGPCAQYASQKAKNDETYYDFASPSAEKRNAGEDANQFKDT